MTRPLSVCGVLLLLLFHSAVAQDGPKKKNAYEEALRNDKAFKSTGILSPPQDANDLSMEVNSLRTMYLFRGTDPDLADGTQHPDGPRLTLIRTKAENCKQKSEREPAVVSDAYRKLLVDLRAALIAVDAARIEELDAKLQELQAKEEPDLDDQIEITDLSRKSTIALVKTEFTAEQAANYIASYGRELPNPRTLLIATMRIRLGKVADTPKSPPAEWKKIREFAIRECSWQLGGLVARIEEARATEIGALLDDAYAFSDEDLKKFRNHQALRNRAKNIANQVGPTDLLKNVIEHDVAELLSNPRTPSAASARQLYLAWKSGMDKK
jgi:hypothetical protein